MIQNGSPDPKWISWAKRARAAPSGLRSPAQVSYPRPVAGRAARGNKAKRADARYRLKQSQESVDFICELLGDMISKTEQMKLVAAKFGISNNAARSRIESVWKHLERTAGTGSKVDREAVGRSLRRVMREARELADLGNVIDTLIKNGVDPDDWKTVLAKWEPHKSWSVILKAADQLARLEGLNAADRVDVNVEHQTHEVVTLTQQERQERIRALLNQGRLQIPEGHGERPTGAARALHEGAN